MSILTGVKVMISPYILPIAVLKIRHDFGWCTEEFRASYDTWLLDLFGTKEVAYIISGDTLAVSPSHYAMLRMMMHNVEVRGGGK